MSSKFSSSFYVDDNITKRSLLSEIVHCSKNLTWIGNIASNEKLCLPFIRHLCILKSCVIKMHAATSTARAIIVVLAQAHRCMHFCGWYRNPINYMCTTQLMFHIFWEFCYFKIAHLRVHLSLSIKARLGHKFNFQVNEISYELQDSFWGRGLKKFGNGLLSHTLWRLWGVWQQDKCVIKRHMLHVISFFCDDLLASAFPVFTLSFLFEFCRGASNHILGVALYLS